MVTIKQNRYRNLISDSEFTINLTCDDVQGSFEGQESENRSYRLNGCSCVTNAYTQNVHLCQTNQNAPWPVTLSDICGVKFHKRK